MNDREMLELAAKAVNHGVLVDSSGKVCGSYNKDAGPNLFGNPLNENGDAFSLLVLLKLDVMFLRGFEEVCVQGEGSVDTPYCLGETIEVSEDFADDIAAVTRRAIVRAAAEIGKTMQEQH